MGFLSLVGVLLWLLFLFNYLPQLFLSLFPCMVEMRSSGINMQ
jgi:hypothetical protein